MMPPSDSHVVSVASEAAGVEGPVDPRIAAALTWCAVQTDQAVTLAIPFALPAADLHALLARIEILSIVLAPPLDPGLMSERIGAFLPTEYTLASAVADRAVPGVCRRP